MKRKGLKVEDMSVSLQKMLAPFGVEISEPHARLVVKHLSLMLEANKRVNLTAVKDLSEGLVLHCVDSLLFLPHLPQEGSFVDIGTGGGFPGIPLSICSGCQGVLIDSVAKKVHEVDGFIQRLEIQNTCKAQAIRAEDLARNESEQFDIVVARAVAPINVLLEYASPLLKTNGQLVISKAHPQDDELDHAEKACELTGMRIVSRETLALPQNFGTRTLMTYEKTYEPKVKLPRRNGMARKRPLGE